MVEVHRDTDSRACGAVTTVSLQNNFYINNLLVAVQGDPNSHGAGGLNASINPGNIFVNNLEVVMNGSSAQADSLCPIIGGAHCGPSATSGSPNVFAYE